MELNKAGTDFFIHRMSNNKWIESLATYTTGFRVANQNTAAFD